MSETQFSSDVTDAELAVLQRLWIQGPSTIRQLTQAFYPEGKAAHYATVQKLLVRLEAKNYVQRDRSPWPHVFVGIVGKDMMIERELRKTAEKYCGGSSRPLLEHLLRVDPDSMAVLRELQPSIVPRRPKDGTIHPPRN